MTSIQGGTATVLGSAGQALAFAYTDAISLILQVRTNDAWISLSEGGLDVDSQRFKLHKDSSPDPNNLVLTFSQPTTGIIYFASASALADANIVMWQI
jgi:hypothetical protein